jgi:hypothetical protein
MHAHDTFMHGWKLARVASSYYCSIAEMIFFFRRFLSLGSVDISLSLVLQTGRNVLETHSEFLHLATAPYVVHTTFQDAKECNPQLTRLHNLYMM